METAKTYAQIILVARTEIVTRTSHGASNAVRVLYLDLQSMTPRDLELWARFKAMHMVWEWPHEYFDDHKDICEWLGMFSAETLAPCFVAPELGAHWTEPPRGAVTGVYVVNHGGSLERSWATPLFS